ncbi:MAG: hypothetical protein ACKVK6_05745, partial [bacterium]
MREIDPRIEVTLLPVDPDSDWASDTSHLPHDEPPAWAQSQADARRTALAGAEALITLSTPKGLMDVAP